MTGDLWLSLVELDPRHHATRAARHNACARHHIVLAAFPGAADRQQAGILYVYHPATTRQPPRLLVQSTRRRHGRTITLTSVTFGGVLTVTDPSRLREQAVAGIGPGKAYGNGLLIISHALRRTGTAMAR